MFKQSKELRKNITFLFNYFNNRFENLVNSNGKDNVISRCHNRNVTSLEILVTRRNTIADHSKIKEAVTERNRVVCCYEIKIEIESENEDTFDISFLY